MHILHFTFKTSFAEVKQEYVGLSLTENATTVCFESLYPSDPGYKHEEKYLSEKISYLLRKRYSNSRD